MVPCMSDVHIVHSDDLRYYAYVFFTFCCIVTGIYIRYISHL